MADGGREVRLTGRNPWASGGRWSWTCPECWHLIAAQPTRDRAVALIRLHVACHGRGWRVLDGLTVVDDGGHRAGRDGQGEQPV